MSTAFIGEIRLFGGDTLPTSWLPCEGQTLNIADYGMLFYVIGHTYGPGTRTTFVLPDLRGRVPIMQGQAPGSDNYPLGQTGGSMTKSVNAADMSRHTHTLNVANADATLTAPANGTSLLAKARASSGPVAGRARKAYAANIAANMVALNSDALADAGTQASVTLDNAQPYLACKFGICFEGGSIPSGN